MRLHDIPRPDPVIPEWMRVVYAYYTIYHLPRQNLWRETLDRWEIYRTASGRLRLRATITNHLGRTYRNYWTAEDGRRMRRYMTDIRAPETIPNLRIHTSAR